MLYCNHCYARVVMRADNASATTCVFCKQTIKTPVELTEYAGLVAQQKHKKINTLKNMLGALYYIALWVPLIIHVLLIFSQRPHEFHDYRVFSSNPSTPGVLIADSYLFSGLAFIIIPVFFSYMTQNMVVKLDYINFKKNILCFVIPLAIIGVIIIYWESLFNVKHFPFNPSFALLDTAIKIVQLVILCLLVFTIMKLKTVYLAFRGIYFLQIKKEPLSVLTSVLLAVSCILYISICCHFYWYRHILYNL